jgi:hypothetical protein
MKWPKHIALTSVQYNTWKGLEAAEIIGIQKSMEEKYY